MRLSMFEQVDEFCWRMAPSGKMRVPIHFHASADLLRDMEDGVLEQMVNVAGLPGVVQAVHAMPDAHPGYAFPIGGVAAFDPDRGGIVSAGGVGFDISCGVRTLLTNLHADDIMSRQKELADHLFRRIPAGVGSTGAIRLKGKDMDAMLAGGANWAVRQGYGEKRDLERIELQGRCPGADPEQVSELARKRQEDEIGTLGSGNHYLEVQRVAEILDRDTATAFGLRPGDAAVSIHCGSRGLGHQVATDFTRRMGQEASKHGISLPDRGLACVPVRSATGQAYLGAMRAAINCALANRQILSHLAREAFADVFPQARLSLLYDVSHNTCLEETHRIDGRTVRLHVHRKGATRALPPGHPDLPAEFAGSGQPVLIGGSMGTSSYILAGLPSGATSFHSACHGAGRAMSRKDAEKRWKGREVVSALADRGIAIRTPSFKGVAEEAPGAYKDVNAVIRAAHGAGLAKPVARLEPLICVKG